MWIGILSDSHGKPEPVRRALAQFDAIGVGLVIHCGDVGGVDVLDELVGRPCRLVWGNTDEVGPAMWAYCRTVGLPWPEAVPLRFDLAGKRIVVFHGHESGLSSQANLYDADYIFHGHSHECRDERIPETGARIINPGALHRARKLTAAVLNLATDELRFLHIK